MKTSKLLVPALCLSAALLSGCSQTQTQGADTQTDPAPVGQTASEAAMSDWQDSAFYERPMGEIADDLALLGFEQTSEHYDEESAFFTATFEGAPASNPVQGADSTVTLDVFLSEPAFREGVDEFTLQNLAEDAAPNGFDVFFYFPEVDSSEYEGLARKVADAAGLGAFTDSYVGDAPFSEGREVGNFAVVGSFNGTEAQCMLVVSRFEGEDAVPNPDAPLVVSYGYYV